ncbi:retrovirus-related pol polyprotein from transposon TNT 1-94 [Tanacetum coccineum]
MSFLTHRICVIHDIQDAKILDVDENKKIQKQLKKANATLTQELTECKSILAETSRTLGESNSIRDSCLVALQNKQTEFERYKAFNDRTVDYDKLERKLNETLGLLAQKEIVKKEGLVKEKTKVITDLKLKEEKDIDKMISLENQSKFLNEIVYKRSQSIQTIHMLAPKCPTFNGRPTFANPMYLKKAQYEKPCLYAIPHDQSDPANRLVPDREETLTLDNESRSKLNKDLVKPFDYTKLNSLYEIFKPPTQHYEIQFAQANEIRKKMWRKSFVKTKPNIFKNIDFLPVSKSISKSRQAYNVMTNNINHLKEIVDQAWVKHSNDRLHLRNPTAQDMEILIKTCLIPLALKTQNDSFAFVHELKQEMHADLKYVESLEDEIDELENYEITELQCLYLHKVRECDCLAQKLSKQTEFVKQLKNDTVCKEKASNVFRKEREQYFEIQDLKAQLQDKNIAICELKKLIEKCKGKSVDTKFDKPSVVRQPNAQRIPKPSVLGKPAPFSDSLERKNFAKKKSVSKTNESEGLSKPVTPQNLPRTATQATSRNTNHRATSTGVAHRTNVSRPQPRSNQMKDKVLPNTSQVKFKKTEVEDHPRISSISNQTKSVTACNDSLNSRTSNVNVVCATYGVFNSNHDACVSMFLTDVNARTKKPNVVPISTRKPKSQANKYVATPHKKTAASESTTTNSKSYYRMLYKKTSKAWKWWIEQQCPSGYKWVPKTKMKWMPKVGMKIIQLILFIVDSGCTKRMTGNLSLLCNFVEKYIENLRVVRDIQKRLLTGNRGTECLYIFLFKKQLHHSNLSSWQSIPTQLVMASKTFSSQHRLHQLDFQEICCDWFTKTEVRQEATMTVKFGFIGLEAKAVASINGKRYILVIVDDYFRYTWTLFLCSKDETLKVLKDFLMMIQRNLQALVISVRTDRDTEFLNKTLNAFFKEEGIEHQTSTPQTPEQNSVVESRNRTLVEAARTMLSASKLPLFFWDEAIATTCYTQNRSIIIPTHEKTAYHIINDRKPLSKHLHIFCFTYTYLR